MAFIIAGIVAVTTILWCLFMLFAAGMSDSPSAAAGVGNQALWTFVSGMVMSALIAGSHWFPHVGW